MDYITIKMDYKTLTMLFASIYCAYHEIPPEIIPLFVWENIIKILQPYFEGWNYDKFSIKEYIENYIFIIPKSFLSEDEIIDLQKDNITWEVLNGNALLFITMNIEVLD